VQTKFRRSLSLEHEPTKRAYAALHRAASELCEAIKEDFPNAAQVAPFTFQPEGVFTPRSCTSRNRLRDRPRSRLTLSLFALVIPKSSPVSSAGPDGSSAKAKAEPVFVNPHDRFGKVLPKRFTTKRVSAALSGYLTAVEETETAVRLELQALSDSLVQNNDLPVITQAAHWSVICQAMEGHVRRALSSGWSLPSLKPQSDPDMSMKVENLVPYWLPREEAVPNSFDFRGLFLLTAPNMSGKSTLMRSVLACSLLSNAGLFAPCTSAVVPRFDGFFLRTASYDIPAEDKSAFALEMDDVRVMLRDSSGRSLALVDELGKGTSARDGASLAGALLEEMDRVSITGIFATHLHELFDLPLHTETLSYKRMGIDWEDNENPRWTFKMEDGKCTDSLALQVGSALTGAATIKREVPTATRSEKRKRRFEDGGAACSMDRGVHVLNPEVDGGGGAWWPIEDGEGWGDGSSAGARQTATNRTNFLQVVSRVTGRPEGDLISIDSGYGTPPALEGRSCVYVLREKTELQPFQVAHPPASLHHSSPASGGGAPEEAGVWFYVGESDAIRERLRRHAARWADGSGSGNGGGGGGGGGGKKAFKLDAVVVPVENRSESRRLETALIRAMKSDGFHLVSDKDGSRTHFSWR
ncbi:unnamed protein product, partial [Scytosiphon promiscuus]